MDTAKASKKVIKTKDKEVIGYEEKGELFSGPLPSPEILEAYLRIDPTFAERIMKMAEDNNQSFIENTTKDVQGHYKGESRGQWLSFLLGVVSIGAGVFFAILGLSSAAISAIFAGISPILIASINNVIKTSKTKN